MNVQTLIFDLDGTLLNSEGKLSARTIDVLCQLSARGLTLVYATGRSPFMASLVQGIPPGYFLCNNGAQIYHQNAITKNRFHPRDEQLLDAEVLAPDVARQIIDAARKHHLHLECNYSTHTVYEYINHEQIKCYGNPILEINAQHVNWDHLDLRHCVKFATMGEEEQLRPFTQALSQSLPGQLHFAYSYSGYLELTAPTLSKRERIPKLFQILGSDFAHTMAFGDGLNDVQTLHAAAVGVMMSNSHPRLLEQGHKFYLAPDHDREGVAQFLRCWFHLP